MKGLLVKDICIILQQKKFFGLVLLLSVFLNSMDSSTFSVSYLTFVCSFFVISSIAYDEADNGYRFLFTLPIRRESYVGAKYILAVFTVLFSWLLGYLIALACCFAKNQLALMQTGMGEECIVLLLILLFMAIMLPVQFKFGSEKGRFVMAFIFCGCALLGFLVCEMAKQPGQWEEVWEQIANLQDWLVKQPKVALVSAAGAGTVLIMGISYWVSVAVMRRKEF